MGDDSRFRWRCRRGTRELDLVLMRWLEHHFETASPARRQAFLTLTERPDPDLADWLLAGLPPPQDMDAEERGLIEQMRP